MKEKFILFLTGFIQISLVSVNMVQIAHHRYVGAFIVAFIIAITWSLNVKRAAFGGWTDRIFYASGCSTGCLAGLFITDYFRNTFQ